MLALLPALLSALWLVGSDGDVKLAEGVWHLGLSRAIQAVSPCCCQLWVPRQGGLILLVLSITEEQRG